MRNLGQSGRPFLEAGFLVDILYSSSGSFRRRLRKRKKVYATSPNLTTSLQAIGKKDSEFGQAVGRLVETAVLSSLKSRFRDVYFWSQKGKEVDFVIRTTEGVLPIEVKFKGSLKRADLTTLFDFMQKNQIERGILISRNKIDVVKKGDFTLGTKNCSFS